jgi:hypothetical protein
MTAEEKVERDENTSNEKLRKLLADADLASDNTSTIPTASGKSDSEYFENRPPHHQ